MRIVLATSNDHKITELRALLAPTGWHLLTGKDVASPLDPDEDGETYEANATIKARAWAEMTGLPALADDSGLEVDALGGEPGVRSARYAPTSEQRIAKLLGALQAVEEGRRSARFVSAVALALPRGHGKGISLLVRRGTCAGAISRSVRGAEGFGYDPVFLVDGAGGRTMAELSFEEKNKVSHRAHAIAALLHAFASETLVRKPG